MWFVMRQYSGLCFLLRAIFPIKRSRGSPEKKRPRSFSFKLSPQEEDAVRHAHFPRREASTHGGGLERTGALEEMTEMLHVQKEKRK